MVFVTTGGGGGGTSSSLPQDVNNNVAHNAVAEKRPKNNFERFMLVVFLGSKITTHAKSFYC